MGTNERLSGDSAGGTAVATETDHKVQRPRMYKVLLHNDDYTTMEFVVFILQSIFYRTEAESVRIMLHVHHKGAGVAGTYTYEIAETKVAKVTQLARENDYPLRCSLEPV